jgi:hypothetical protein
MARSMGIPFSTGYFKKKNRWSFVVKNYIGIENFRNPILPPIKAARPNLSFKEITIEHLVETITIPGKPEFSTLDVTLYDLQCKKNPMFTWLKKLYDPQHGEYRYLIDADDSNESFKIPQADLELLSGCGETLELWRYEGLYPQKIDWGDLDMTSSDVVTVDVSFRYDRAYYIED